MLGELKSYTVYTQRIDKSITDVLACICVSGVEDTTIVQPLNKKSHI